MATASAPVARQAKTLGLLRATLAVLAALFAVAGILLLAAPGSTRRLFAWGLKPRAVAELTGGLFLGAAAAYALAARRVRSSGRGFCLLSIVLTVPTFGYTLINKDVFDFGRWQAILWLVVFTAAPVLVIVLLFAGAWRFAGSGPPLAAWARLALGLIAAAAAAGATAIWISPEGSAWLPYPLKQFSGQLVGMWIATTGFACLWAALRPAEEADTFVFAASALLAGALIGAVRGFEDVGHTGRGPFLAVLAAAFVLCLSVQALRPRSAPAAPPQ